MSKHKNGEIPSEDEMEEMLHPIYEDAVKDRVSVRFAIWSGKHGITLLPSEAIKDSALGNSIRGYTIDFIKQVDVLHVDDESIEAGKWGKNPKEKTFVVFLKPKK